jgi:chromatin segregation and condensation protein Rec8/ScpA/Scc1 (kleisin family)
MESDTILLLQALRENVDAEGWALFSRLTASCDPRTTVYTLICLLHMVQEGRAVLRQDKLFAEIFIRITGAAEKTSSS